MIFEALGVPMKWKKYRGGLRYQWIGFEVDFDRFTLGISTSRAEWVRNWLSDRIETKTVDLSDFAAVLGRLGFAMGPLYHLRPFILPLYAWSAAVGRRGVVRLPWSVLFIFRVIYDMLGNGGRYIEIVEHGEDLGEAFRADAKAEGQSVVVGGWESRGGVQPRRARWFAVTLTRANAAWAFSKGEPFRTIASLELFGTLLCVMIFSAAWRTSSSASAVAGGLLAPPTVLRRRCCAGLTNGSKGSRERTRSNVSWPSRT